MPKIIHSSKWIALFIALSLILASVFGAITYIVDPYFQYRVKDNSYMLNGWYVGPGLIKNYDYDTLIVGSSMTKNFDMDVFRETVGGSPLHIALGGMNRTEMKELLRLAESVGKASNYYVCVDLSLFQSDGESRIASYLLNDSFLAKLQYSLSYESWFRFMPVDTVFSALKAIGYNFPQKYVYQMSIDRLEDNRLDGYSYSEEVVLDNYRSGAYSVSEVDTEGLLDRMTLNIDVFLKDLDTEGAAYHFFFPPYSALFWCNAQEKKYYDVYIEAKKFFIKRAAELGCEVYDFQSEDITLDLNNYTDTTHYSPDINDWMAHCFASGNCLTTPENIESYQAKLLENVKCFRERYSDLFEHNET